MKARLPLILGALVLFAVFVYLAVGSIAHHEVYRNTSYRQSYVTPSGADSTMVFKLVNPREFHDGPVPAIGDTLVALNGDSLTWSVWKENVPVKSDIPLDFELSYLDNGVPVTTAYRVSPVEPGSVRTHQFFLALQISLSLLFLAFALWVLLKQGAMREGRILTLLLLTLVATFVYSLHFSSMAYRPEPGPWFLWALFVVYIFALLKTGAWLHLAMEFPYRSRGFQRSWLIWTLSYAPLAIGLYQPLVEGLEVLNNAGLNTSPLDSVLMIVMALQVLGGIVLLARKRKSHRIGALQKRQLNVIMFGAGLGLALMMANVIMITVVGLALLTKPWAAIIISLISLTALSLIPLSFMYAFSRYRLMEAEWRLRRGTRLVLINGVLAAVAGAAVAVLARALTNLPGLNDPVAVALISVGVAFLLLMGYRKLQARLERGLFPESAKLRELLDDLMAASAKMPDRASFWRELSRRLRDGIGLERLEVSWFDDRNRPVGEEDGPWPVDPDGALNGELTRLRRPLPADELLDNPQLPLSEDEAAWLREQRISLILPLTLHGRTAGLLALVFADNHEGLRAVDLGLLRQLAAQAALQAENLRLLEETLDKQRLEEQLQMARDVQQGFLPRDLPETPGLTVCAECLSSLEVAGDYYDVIALPDGRTLLAVADVSGKGAGAAMIMANLQAALRTVADMDRGLGEVVARINTILHRNTTPEQYVTFYAAIFDPETGRLTSVNAGHNPPYLQRSDGSLLEIEATGPILGVLPGMPYEEVNHELTPGDRLVAFTDGVTEAMDEADEEFGEQRLEQLLLELKDQPLAELLPVLKQRVESHCAGRDLGDDFTVLVFEARTRSESVAV